MSCHKIGRTIRNAYKFVDEKVLSHADEIIEITGKIKALYGSLTVKAIEGALGIGSKLHASIDAALTKVYNIEVIGKTLAEKFKELLETQPTEYATNGVLAKIASVATGIEDARKLPEHIYDQSVDIAIARTKVPD